MKRKFEKGITLIALVITIIILVIIAGVSINLLFGQYGVVTKAKYASNETTKEAAKEAMNLKITNIQISSYTENQELPNLQYLADKLCEDNDMEYVLTQSKANASLDKIDVTNLSSIYTKLKEYPYEFEINSSLQLASIDGVKVADNNSDGTVTLTQSQYDSILNRLATLENNSNNTSVNENYSTEEQVIGTWIDGKTLYKKTYTGSLTIPNNTTEKTYTYDENISSLNIDTFMSDVSYFGNGVGMNCFGSPRVLLQIVKDGNFYYYQAASSNTDWKYIINIYYTKKDT